MVFFLFTLVSFSQETSFDEEKHSYAPDYSTTESWSALPFNKDVADVLPKGETWVSDSLKEVDVFYVHPTIYQKGSLWNAGLDMKKINRKVDKYPVRLQASVFNASCRVYAPRYRQAVVGVFYDESVDGDKALNLAYQDVKRAFEYFLENHSNGRPFIIAGHSQGTHHTRRLLREMIDTTELKDRMVAAYIIGFTLVDTLYENLKICDSADETGCYVTWMSYKKDFVPDGVWHKKTQSINPLTWTTDTGNVIVEDYSSTVVFNPKRIRTRKMEVQIADIGGNVLWVDTKAPWFRFMKNLHIADYGLFYMDIRKNVKTRIDNYFSTNSD
ncbi:MAG TPA: DUF3089 domain-containing protein [Flavobacteriales bacterium]|nr:DUF3089 domain-containing protein [Flavobacteriales bacterium]